MYSVSAVRPERVIVISVSTGSIFVFICTGKQFVIHPIIEALRIYIGKRRGRGRWGRWRRGGGRDEGRRGGEMA
jgi:hypothetical protein